MAVKLNIGSGDVDIEGWIPIDRKLGHEALPLPRTVKYNGSEIALDDNSVDEIRASHILEHFSFADAQAALNEWTRVLKPGGQIRIAVPDVDKCLQSQDNRRLFFLMGGQTDSNDYHRSAYDRARLEGCMRQAGLTDIQQWESENTDCAALPISLNLMGTKADDDTEQLIVKVGAYMTLPRYEAACARGLIEKALEPLKIGLTTSQGVFWGQCMQRMFETAVENELDWILTIDFDSMITSEHISILLDEFGRTPMADAMAALQCRRGKPFPLLTVGHSENIETDGSPIKVTTAHFGLTLIRVEALRTLPKPWFKAEPDENGEWGDDRLDDDIWFWHQWRLNNKTIYVTPRCSIGHLEEMVAVFDEQLQPKHLYLNDWREQNGINAKARR